jgi:hypothetical protein
MKKTKGKFAGIVDAGVAREKTYATKPLGISQFRKAWEDLDWCYENTGLSHGRYELLRNGLLERMEGI